MGKGCIVVLIGGDGCGKSTIASVLIRKLRAGGLMVRHQHWRPGVLPSPRAFIRQKPSSDPTRPHQKKSHPPVRSRILSVYYFIDFWFGYLFRILPFVLRGGVMVAERYMYDILFDPLRHRLDISEKWSRFLCGIAPRTDLIVVLTGNPVVFHNRKRELGIKEIADQQAKIIRYFKKNRRAIFVATSDQTAEVCANVIAARMSELIN